MAKKALKTLKESPSRRPISESDEDEDDEEEEKESKKDDSSDEDDDDDEEKGKFSKIQTFLNVCFCSKKMEKR